jgi:hypothetical protein
MRLKELKEEVLEMHMIAKANVSTIWFWVPVLFALYIPFQMYLMLVNPLLLAIAPAVLIVYLTYEEERGFRAKYKLGAAYTKTAGEPVFWDIERLITESRNKKTKKKAA